MQVFNLSIGGKDSDYAFDAWMECYPESFVLNWAGNQSKLHFANCKHFYRLDSGLQITEYPKYCSVDRSEIDKWAQANGCKYERCKDCENKGLL